MTALTAFVGLAAFVAVLCLGFETTVIVFLGTLPFLAWAQIHISGVPWSLVPSALLLLLTIQAISARPVGSRGRPAFGLTAVVLLYAGVASAQAFSPGLPSVLLGLRGSRLVVEPLVLYFVGSEVARRPALVRRVLRVIVATGVVVIAYAGKQWLFGFDAAERSYFRHTFPMVVRERRLTSTLPGATALGVYATLVALVLLSRVVRHRGHWARWALLGAAAMFTLFLTGQRGIQVAGLGAGLALVAVAVLRPGTRQPAARIGEALTIVVALMLAIAIITPVQDRRLASAPDRTALDAARLKLALLKSGEDETSFRLRRSRLDQVADALGVAPLGWAPGSTCSRTLIVPRTAPCSVRPASVGRTISPA